jgi:tRNA nucleotidyltransferase (CCA-adding enzyme)
MEVILVNPEFSTAKEEIIKKLEVNGFQAYFVGGAIRDLLIDRPIGDIDIATSALPEQVMELFPNTIPVGIQHGTVIVMIKDISYEVTTFRNDEDYADFRRPTNVIFVNSLTEDLKRRDFTINAIAMSSSGTLLDPFNGQTAITKRVIETVGHPHERFNEDALRMMRAIRFHSQLSFTIEENTKHAMKKHAPLLRHVSIERITTEIEKTLTGRSCHTAIHILVETGLYKSILNLSDYVDSLRTWPNLNYTALTNRAELWAIVCFLLKVQHIDSFLKQWKLPTRVIKDARNIYEGLLHIQTSSWTPYFMFENGKEHTLSIERCYSILLQLPVEERVITRLNEYLRLPLSSKSPLCISGHDLLQWENKKPGPWVAEVLTAIEKAVINGILENKQESIKEWLGQCNRL